MGPGPRKRGQLRETPFPSFFQGTHPTAAAEGVGFSATCGPSEGAGLVLSKYGSECCEPQLP